MTSNPVSALTVALLLIGAAADRYCNADTIIPVTQDRFTSVLLDTDCDGQTSAGEAAAGFEPFDSSVDTSQQCPRVPIFAFANANQNSSIGGSSMTLFANAVYNVQTPGSALASAISNFIVTFELPRTSIVSVNGVLLGDGQVPGVETTAQLTGPTGEMLFSSTLTGPFPFGEATEQSIDEELTLEPGVYTLQARALAADAFDIGKPFFAGESALNLTVEVTVLGDLDGDGHVGITDFLILLGNWGPCPQPCPPTCPPDLDQDCEVGIVDFLTLLGNWG